MNSTKTRNMLRKEVDTLIKREINDKKASKKVLRPAGVASKRKLQSGETFGPIATIDTAPVSIGNSIRGSAPVVVPTKDGARIKGRDFLLTVDTINNTTPTWTVCGGAPITPSCLSASILKSYNNMYSEYYVHSVAFHFITAAPTNSAGSILIYVGKDRGGPGVVTSSSNMLPFVLSDEHTILSPIWTNASATYSPAPKWFTTGLGNDEDLALQACGEFFILSKASTSTIPGYVLMDYDISFRIHQVNIKSLTFPVTRMKYTQLALTRTGFSSTATTTVAVASWNAGVLLDGVTQSVAPSGFTLGDVYKVVLNTTNSSFTGATVANLLALLVGNSTYQAMTITDGFVLYLVPYDNNTVTLYSTYQDAITLTNPLRHNVTATVTFYVPCYASLVGSVGNALIQANY